MGPVYKVSDVTNDGSVKYIQKTTFDFGHPNLAWQLSVFLSQTNDENSASVVIGFPVKAS